MMQITKNIKWAKIQNGKDKLSGHEQKTYYDLGVLTTNLLVVLSIYTLMLSVLSQLVDYSGASTFIDIVLLLSFAVVIYKVLKKSSFPLKSFGWTLDNWWEHVKMAVMWTLPLLIFFLLLKWALITFIPAFSHIPLFHPQAAFQDIGFSISIFLFTIGVYIVFSIVQEFIARVGLQSAFNLFLPKTKGRELKAIFISNLLFAAAHSHIGILFALTAFIPGLFWGWIFSRQRSIVGVSVSHMLIGVWVLFILGFTQFMS